VKRIARHLVALFSVMVTLGGLPACDGTGDPVRIIVPAGYQGVVEIVADGNDVGGHGHVNGGHEYTIPAGGSLHVRSGRPFERWHEFSMADSAGNAIRLASSNPASSQLVYDDLGTRVTNDGPPVRRWVVGTPDYVKRFMAWHYGGEHGLPPAPATRPSNAG
jgi:hypothetical protein